MSLLSKLSDKLIESIMEPINESMDLLHSIDNKIDIQNEAKLKGALKLLLQAPNDNKNYKLILTQVLSTFTESSEYYLMSARSAENEFRELTEFKATKRKLRGFTTFGYKMWEPAIYKLGVLCNFYSLYFSSELARLACMKVLNFAELDIQSEFDSIKSLSSDLGKNDKRISLLGLLVVGKLDRNKIQIFPSRMISSYDQMCSNHKNGIIYNAISATYIKYFRYLPLFLGINKEFLKNSGLSFVKYTIMRNRISKGESPEECVMLQRASKRALDNELAQVIALMIGEPLNLKIEASIG